jgi:hypothetical protein
MPIEIKDMVSRLNAETYTGEQADGYANGQGIYRFSNGIVYTGKLYEGMFNEEGTLKFPQGGKFVAKWNKGKLVNGTYFYHDELKYSTQDWSYCTDADRRFWTGIQHGIELADAPQLTDKQPSMWIPAEAYETGDGYYDPLDNNVYTYEGKVQRQPSEKEMAWAIRKCRIGVGEDDKSVSQEEEGEEEMDYDVESEEEEESESEYSESEDELDDALQGDADSGARTRPGTAFSTVAEWVDDVFEEIFDMQLSERSYVNKVVDDVFNNTIGDAENTTIGDAKNNTSGDAETTASTNTTSRPGTSTSMIAKDFVDEIVDDALKGPATVDNLTSEQKDLLAGEVVDSVLEQALGGEAKVTTSAGTSVLGTQSRELATAVVNEVFEALELST